MVTPPLDELLFQVASAAGGIRTFTVLGQPDGAASQPKSELTTFSRFMPERTDDYAREDDRFPEHLVSTKFIQSSPSVP